jgi:subtilisin family serine protease
MKRTRLRRFAAATGSTFARTTPAWIAALGVSALLAGCGGLVDEAEDEPELLGTAELADKTEDHNPPAPPDPPPLSADENEDLVKKGKPKKDINVHAQDIQGHYIVQVKAGKNPNAVAAAVNAAPKHVFTKAIPGFSGPLNQGQLIALQNRPDVELVEADQLVTTSYVQYMDGLGHPWGLDRTDQYYLPLNGKYIYFRYAAGVRAYVIDTGIQSNHPDFYSALAMYDAFGGNGQDCHGHGTHVAGTVGGNTYGVAKQSYLRGVRVLGCNGSGSWSGVIAGIDWVANYHIKPAVANMSLGGGYSTIVNNAVNNLANMGVFVAVAAGGSNGSACSSSPSSASNVFSTAASDSADNRAWFSNYGGCVTAYAPGVNIKSDYIGSSTAIMSGTSMASPHVTGTAALYKAIYGDAPWFTIKNNLVAWSIPNVINGNPTGTPNRLLYQPF